MEENWRLRDLQRRCWRLPDPDRHLEVDGEYGWRSLCVVVGSELIGARQWSDAAIKSVSSVGSQEEWVALKSPRRRMFS